MEDVHAKQSDVVHINFPDSYSLKADASSNTNRVCMKRFFLLFFFCCSACAFSQHPDHIKDSLYKDLAQANTLGQQVLALSSIAEPFGITGQPDN